MAICSWDGEFTYAEMYRHATNLAHRLAFEGVTQEDPVAICLNKSTWAVTAIMGVLFASATCIPVDPKAPHLRQQSLLKELSVRLMICDAESTHCHRSDAATKIISYP